jgi:hypothetical protein
MPVQLLAFQICFAALIGIKAMILPNVILFLYIFVETNWKTN